MQLTQHRSAGVFHILGGKHQNVTCDDIGSVAHIKAAVIVIRAVQLDTVSYHLVQVGKHGDYVPQSVGEPVHQVLHTCIHHRKEFIYIEGIKALSASEKLVDEIYEIVNALFIFIPLFGEKDSIHHFKESFTSFKCLSIPFLRGKVVISYLHYLPGTVPAVKVKNADVIRILRLTETRLSQNKLGGYSFMLDKLSVSVKVVHCSGNGSICKSFRICVHRRKGRVELLCDGQIVKAHHSDLFAYGDIMSFKDLIDRSCRVIVTANDSVHIRVVRKELFHLFMTERGHIVIYGKLFVILQSALFYGFLIRCISLDAVIVIRLTFHKPDMLSAGLYKIFYRFLNTGGVIKDHAFITLYLGSDREHRCFSDTFYKAVHILLGH